MAIATATLGGWSIQLDHFLEHPIFFLNVCVWKVASVLPVFVYTRPGVKGTNDPCTEWPLRSTWWLIFNRWLTGVTHSYTEITEDYLTLGGGDYLSPLTQGSLCRIGSTVLQLARSHIASPQGSQLTSYPWTNLVPMGIWVLDEFLMLDPRKRIGWEGKVFCVHLLITYLPWTACRITAHELGMIKTLK